MRNAMLPASVSIMTAPLAAFPSSTHSNMPAIMSGSARFCSLEASNHRMNSSDAAKQSAATTPPPIQLEPAAPSAMALWKKNAANVYAMVSTSGW